MVREDGYNHRKIVSDEEMLEFLSRRADIWEMVYQEMLKENKKDKAKADEIARKNREWMQEETRRNGVEPSFF